MMKKTVIPCRLCGKKVCLNCFDYTHNICNDCATEQFSLNYLKIPTFIILLVILAFLASAFDYRTIIIDGNAESNKNDSDTFILEGSKTSNFGTNSAFKWGNNNGGSAGYEVDELLNLSVFCNYFNLGTVFDEVNLSLYCTEDQNSNVLNTLRTITSSWSISSAIWNNRPTFTAQNHILSVTPADIVLNIYNNFSINASEVQRQCNLIWNGQPELSFGLMFQGGDTAIAATDVFASSNDATNKPIWYVRSHTTDVAKPRYTNFFNNASTNTYKNGNVFFNVSITDDTGLASFIFSSNNTGVFINTSAISISGYAANISQNITVIKIRDNFICGVYYFEDLASNENNTNMSCFFVQDAPPEIPVIYSPTNNTTYTQVNFSYSSSDLDNDTLSYYIYLNDTLNITVSSNSTNESLADGSYKLIISAYDGSKFSNSSAVYFRIDNTMPTISYKGIANGGVYAYGSLKNMTVTAADNYGVYIFNINLTSDDGVIYNSSLNLSDLPRNYTVTALNIFVNKTGTFTINAYVCDSHTATGIDSVSYTKSANYLDYKLLGGNLKITALDNITSLSTSKTDDRYAFSFDYKNPTALKRYKIEADDITYLRKSRYAAHFILYNKYWLDFEPYSASVEHYCDDSCYYIVTVADSSPKMVFNSLGELNCINSAISFSILENPPSAYDKAKSAINSTNLYNMEAFDTQSTSGVLIFIFAFLMFVFLVVLTETTKIAAFGVFSAIYGIFFGILLFSTISALIGVLMIIISLLYMIRSLAFV